MRKNVIATASVRSRKQLVLTLAIVAGFAGPVIATSTAAHAGTCWVNYVGGHAFINCN